ncbi:hypothetical protein [Deinococcus radiotolerans]|uniref:DUF222 domain-containing protein n=1 Tax=Deinococcus radiotolerans TaxID=1309407 RepID=A0ABQ2FHU9_9DEIO|nr:hypothetical protein [Deinococcus radiotolerans]GGK92160.1 hypothetical protein GCM10010844_08280 [Deinococcus radiotolerans]
MEPPTVWTRLRAALSGEQNAETLYAYQRAGATVHDLLDAAERRRFDLTASGTSPFDMPAQVGVELACIWNAFALQTLGDRMLRADEQADPATVGFVPPVTFSQVQAYYQDVQRWLAHATRAAHDPQFQPAAPLPAPLPDWSPVEPCPRPHLDAMIAALSAMRLHAESVMNALEKSTPEAHRSRLAGVRGLFAEAVSRAEYAERMYTPGASQALHEQVEEHAKKAVEGLYHAGQVLSYPALIKARRAPDRTAAAAPRPAHVALPGESGFDPWVMTDPVAAPTLRHDPRARQVITEMWALDPSPRDSVALWQDIQAAIDRGDVIYGRNGGRLIGHYFCTPWASIYEAARPVMIGDTPVPKGKRFTIECAAEGVRVGYPFKREVVIGDFKPSTLDYCDPDAPPPHDD